MTREFRFRAWHCEDGNPMVTPYMAYSHPFPVEFWRCVESESLTVIVMQYTGLNDKAGKPIYEGDILKTPYGLITEVKWGEGCFYIFPAGCETNITLMRWNDVSAIIGNIYENGELLK